jgi:hypothetical protein
VTIHITLDIQNEVIALAREAEGRDIKIDALERFPFYEVASKGLAAVRISEFRPDGCFLFAMGALFSPLIPFQSGFHAGLFRQDRLFEGFASVSIVQPLTLTLQRKVV